MMKDIYNIEKHSIMFECSGEKGTGVFISSKSTEYDYILTAKHCLKRYENNTDIIFFNNTFNVITVIKHDTDDVAIIKIEKSSQVSLFSYINYDELYKYNEKIFLYGCPNIARQSEIKHCRLECKFNSCTDKMIRLEVNNEVATFKKSAIEVLKGMSGGAVYIEKDDVTILLGIYVENTYEDFAYRYINIIPLNKVKELLEVNNEEDMTLGFCSKLIEDNNDPLYVKYNELVREDYRNLKEKIVEISPNYNERKIRFLGRKLSNTILEIDKLTENSKNALLYRVFFAANERQLELILEGKDKLEQREVDEWIERYTDYAKEIIDQKSEDYNYPLKSKEIINGIVLNLLNNCFISFDEKGYYEEEGDCY